MNVTVQICIYKRKITSTIFNFLRFHEKTGLASKKNAACQIRQDSNDAIITPITTASVVFCVNDKTADKELVFSLDRK